MRFVIVAKKIFTWDGKLIHERHTRRFYDPETRVGFILEDEKRLRLTSMATSALTTIASW